MKSRLWISFVVWLTAGCGGASTVEVAPESPPTERIATCMLAERGDAKGAARAWAETPDASASNCIIKSVRLDAKFSREILDALAPYTTSIDYDATKFVDAVIASGSSTPTDKASLYLTFGQRVSALNAEDSAALAFDRAIQTRGAPADFVSAARQELARIQIAKSDFAAADRNLEQAVLADRSSLSAVETLVKLRTTAKQANPAAEPADALCEKLWSHDRIEQTKRCVLSLASPSERSVDVLMQAVAKSGLVDRREAEMVSLRAKERFPVAQCYEKRATPTYRGYFEFRIDPPPGPLTEGAYLKLADSVDDLDVRRCFLAYAAFGCISSMRNATCTEASALARYAETLSGAELRKFIEALFEEKGRAYEQLARRASDDTNRVLFQYHLALSHVFARQPEASAGGFRSTAFQVARARCFWKRLYPAEAFNEELLPESLKNKFTTPDCPR